MKKTLSAIGLSLSLLAISACGNEITTSSKPLKLGSLFATTGDLSDGEDLTQAVNLAIETINACGGVNEKPVEMAKADTKTDPNTGAEAILRLIKEENVAGVVGASSSSVSEVTVDFAVRNQVMQISPSSTSPVFTERAKAGEYNGYWARTVPPDTYQAQALAQLAIDRGFDRVATAVINNSYGVGFEQEFIQAFKALGGTIVNENNPVRYNPNPDSLDQEVNNLFADDPEAVLGVMYEETGALLFRSAYERGLSDGVKIFLTDSAYAENLIKNMGTTEEGKSIIESALGTVPIGSGEYADEFYQKWEEKTGKGQQAFLAHTWDAAVLMMLAAELGDENTGTAIKDHLQEVANAPGIKVSDPCQAIQAIRDGKEINYQGASGKIEFNQYGDTTGNYGVWEVGTQGELKIIDEVTNR
mgnify:CR=1 FL=1